MTDLYVYISGDDTTALIGDALEELNNSDKSTFDALNVDWEPPQSPGIAGEPISTAVVLAGSAMVIAAVLRIIERRMEHLQQREMMHIVAEGFDKHPELGERLEEMAKTYSQVSISYGLAKEAWPPRPTPIPS